MAVWLLKQPDPPLPKVASSTVSFPTAVPPASPPTTVSNQLAPAAYVTNRFAWREVEAEEFEQLALNLRAIGCPEKTVRDIIVARARRVLERIERAAEPRLPFWTAGARRTQARLEAERQARSAREQIIARLERILGRDAFSEAPMHTARFDEQAITRFVVGPMPDETFFKVAARLDWFHARRAELNSDTRGVWLDEDHARLAQLRERYHRELGELLSPAQREEMTARMTIIPVVGEVKFEATDLTVAEVRQLGLIRARFIDPLSGHDSILGEQGLADGKEEELRTAERNFLGEARFAQFERAADANFKELFDLGRESNLPREAAEKVFDLRQLTAREFELVRGDKSLPDADRQRRLAQMQAEVQQAVMQVLGATASGQYLGRGGTWLTNLNRL